MKKLTPESLGSEHYNALVDHLADAMNIFKNKTQGTLVPASHNDRAAIVMGILSGLSQSVRYTRLDDPAIAFQVTERSMIKGTSAGSGDINLELPAAPTLLVERFKDGQVIDISPLNAAMVGQSWVTTDGKPLGHRGEVDLSELAIEAFEIEHPGRSSVGLPYLQKSPPRHAQSDPV